jgi:methionyl-tRNA synthetase
MTVRGEKMSKTRGNVIRPEDAVALFGVDGVRYLVLREIPFDRDADITLRGLVRRYNADLANDLGNLVNRTVSMSARYADGALPPVSASRAPADLELQASAARAIADYHAAMERLQFDEALAAVMTLAGAGNGYAESQAPWNLKRGGETQRLAEVLSVMAETCRLLGHLLAPFAPRAAAGVAEQLGVSSPYDERGAGGPGLAQLLSWGAVADAWQTGRAEPLFPRAELPEEGGSLDETPPEDPMRGAASPGVAS